MSLRKLLRVVLRVFLLVSPLLAEQWDAVHGEMLQALTELSKEYFVTGSAGDPEPPPPASAAIQPTWPWMIVVGFTGGVQKKGSKASGVVAMKGRLEAHLEGQNGVLLITFNNFRWRRATTEVLEIVRTARGEDGSVAGIRQPLIVVYGHSWGAGSIGKFARRLKSEEVEISLAIYIDAVSWRNPRVSDNVRYAVNFYQRAGVLKGLPLRGKSKLIPEDPQATCILGSYRIKPDTELWGWAWNPLQPLVYRHHHRIAHDLRLQKYLLEVVNLKLGLLNRTGTALSREFDVDVQDAGGTWPAGDGPAGAGPAHENARAVSYTPQQ